MRNAKELLEMLNECLTPPHGAKHALLVHDHKLMVVVALEKGFQHLELPEEDYDRPAVDLFNEVVAVLKQQKVFKA